MKSINSHFHSSRTAFTHKIEIVIFACIFSMCLFLVFSGNALAYNLDEGARWYGTPGSGCCASINVQFNSFAKSYDRTGAQYGVSAWNASPANVVFNYASGALTIDDVNQCGVGWDGITYWGKNVFGYFMYANIHLNYCLTQSESITQIQGDAAHELGHAIGLDHASGCVLMEASGWCAVVPKQDDINGANALY
jgi:hypothetical protein